MIQKTIPNTLTMANLISGLFAIYFAFHQQLEYAGIAIALAAVFDFFDGMTARLFKAYSDIGKQLDSLADMVSFGVAPAFVILHMMQNSPCIPNHFLAITPAFLIPMAAAWRLAKFNIDAEQSDSFKGLPTPAAALAIAAIPFVAEGHYAYPLTSLHCYPRQVAVVAILAFAMVSSWPLFSLKFKNLSWQDNKIRFIFLVLSIALLLTLQATGILYIIFSYAVLSAIDAWVLRKRK